MRLSNRFLNCTLGLLLFCLFTAGCVSSQQQQAEARQHFTTMMNRMVGQATYEHILAVFGPPSDKTETASEIKGVWEDLSAYGTVRLRQQENAGEQTDYQGWRVRLVFDRRSQLLKSWEEVSQ